MSIQRNSLTQKLFLTLLLFISLPLHAFADCVLFEPLKHLDDIALIVEGTVTEANNDHGELEQCSDKDDCIYRASIAVSQVVKGTLREPSISLEYPYWSGCPGVDTYATGTRHLFFLSSENSLYGTSCGFGALDASSALASRIRQALESTQSRRH